ncbi:MAG: hypothetical protein ACR2IF_00520 [Terriglobales bacterium]
MRELPEVKEAKALMTEAVSWSVVKWLQEKKRVRKTADRANDALDALDQEVKATWSAELKSAYEAAKTNNTAGSDLGRLARQLYQADDAAYRMHEDAEETFDRAERKLSTMMAREGCQKAIRSWELHEQAIRKSESAAQAQ